MPRSYQVSAQIHDLTGSEKTLVFSRSELLVHAHSWDVAWMLKSFGDEFEDTGPDEQEDDRPFTYSSSQFEN